MLHSGLYVKCYWNFHKKLFSVQAMVDGRWKVIAHTNLLYLCDVKFKVSQAGNERVRREKKKNVHAKIEGHIIDAKLWGLELVCDKIIYNPYKHRHFQLVSYVRHPYTYSEDINSCKYLRCKVVDNAPSLARMYDPVLKNHYLSTGTVQPVLHRDNPWGSHHFGPAQYDSYKPVMSQYLREQVEPIVSALNVGIMTWEEAIKAVDRL